MISKVNELYKSLIYILAILIVGCTHTETLQARPAITSASNALENAIKSGGEDYAPIEIKTAQEKISSARLAIKENKLTLAADLANEAKVYALRAEEKADSAKARNDAKKLRENIQILIYELNNPKQKY